LIELREDLLFCQDRLKKCMELIFKVLNRVEKIADVGNTALHLKKMRHTWKNAVHLGKCATLGEMRHTWGNASHVGKCTTLGEMRQIWKNAPHLEKCATLGEMRYS